MEWDVSDLQEIPEEFEDWGDSWNSPPRYENRNWLYSTPNYEDHSDERSPGNESDPEEYLEELQAVLQRTPYRYQSTWILGNSPREEVLIQKKRKRPPSPPECKGTPLKEDNKGYQMIKKLGWKPESGLGPDNDGIRSPLGSSNKRDRRGLGEKVVRGVPAGKENRAEEKINVQKKDDLLSVRNLDQPIEVKCQINKRPSTDLDILVEILEHEERMKIKEAEKTRIEENEIEHRDKERCERTSGGEEVLMQAREDVFERREEKGRLAEGWSSSWNDRLEVSERERPRRASPEGGATTGKYIHKMAQYYMGGTIREPEPSMANIGRQHSEGNTVHQEPLGDANWPFGRMQWDTFPLDEHEKKATGGRESSPKVEMLAGTLDGESQRGKGRPWTMETPEKNQGNPPQTSSEQSTPTKTPDWDEKRRDVGTTLVPSEKKQRCNTSLQVREVWGVRQVCRSEETFAAEGMRLCQIASTNEEKADREKPIAGGGGYEMAAIWPLGLNTRVSWTGARPLVGRKEDDPNELETLAYPKKQSRQGCVLEPIEELEESQLDRPVESSKEKCQKRSEQCADLQKREIVETGELVELFNRACGVQEPEETNRMPDSKAVNSSQNPKDTGTRPKVKKQQKEKVIGDDEDWVEAAGAGDLVVYELDVSLLVPQMSVEKALERWPYANVYERGVWETRKKGQNKTRKEMGTPGTVQWREPPPGESGPEVACLISGYDDRSQQVGEDRAIYEETTDETSAISGLREKWLKKALDDLLMETEDRMERGINIRRVIMVKQIGPQAGKRRATLGEAAKRFQELGLEVMMVSAGSRPIDEEVWSLGEISSRWVAAGERVGVCQNEGLEGEEQDLMSYFIEVRLGQVKVRALIDSGASCSVLSSAVVERAEQLKALRKYSGKSVRGVGNLEIPIASTITTAVQIGSIKTNIRFAVVTAEALPVDAILGCNFLHPMQAVIEMGSGFLSIGKERVRMEGKFVRRRSVASKVVVANTFIVPQRSKALVRGYTETRQCDGKGLFVEPEGECEEGLFVGRTLSQESQGMVLVQVLNPTNNEIIIEKGKVIGSAFPVAPVIAKAGACCTVEEGYQVTLVEGEVEFGGKGQETPADLFDLTNVGRGKEELEELINEFPEVVSRSDYDIGKCLVPAMKIDTGTADPVCAPPRRMGPIISEKVGRHIEQMKKAGILQHSTSEWSSHLVPVMKRDGDIRPCVDLRGLNALTKFQALPIPNIDDTLCSLKGSTIFSTIDAVKGFHQLPLSPRSGKKTAFPFRGELLEFTRVCFGLKNAAGHFQRTMQLVVLAGLSPEECLVYVDDILVHAPDVETHINILRRVFERLRIYGLKIKPSKCQLLKTEVDYLGHRITGEGMKPLENRIDAIIEYPTPINLKQLKRFVGMANYYRDFVPNCSAVMRPLTQAQTKVKFEWDEGCQRAFEIMKKALTEAPILAYPDYTLDAPMILTSDASSGGAGAVLTQVQDGKERVVSYFSKVFSPSQAALSATDQELESLRLAVKHFCPYILGRKLKIRVDHQPIVELSRSKLLSARLFRIYSLLRTLDLTIEYIPGSLNKTADALSRTTEPRDGIEVTGPVVLPSGLREVLIPGGGDALLRAFSHTCWGEQAMHAEVRSKITRAIRTKPEKYKLFTKEEVLARTKGWDLQGKALPLEVASVIARVYKVDVVFHLAGSFPILFKAEITRRPKVNLILKDGVHVNATESFRDSPASRRCTVKRGVKGRKGC